MPADPYFVSTAFFDLLLQRDKSAFTALYDQYAGALFGDILRTTKQAAEAEQILEETFIQVYKNVPEFDYRQGRLFPWMLRIARIAGNKESYGKSRA